MTTYYPVEKVPTYDILECGPRHRFVANGRLVHNSNKLNLQNLTRGGELRRSIIVDQGEVIVVADLSQIEARFVAWFADLSEQLAQFALGKKGDVYKTMATKIFGVAFDDVTKEQRFVAKVCLAGDTLVYTNRGLVPIIDVKTTDMVWDGIEWVHHEGLLPKGVQEVLTHKSLTATPGHEILTEHGWREWQEALIENSLFQSALNSASLPSYGTTTMSLRKESHGGTDLFASVRAATKRCITHLTSSVAGLHDATPVGKSKLRPKGTGSIKTHYPTISIGRGFSIACHRLYRGVQILKTGLTRTMVGEGLPYAMNGSTTGLRFSDISRRSTVGINRISRWIDVITTKAINPATSLFRHASRTSITEGASNSSKKKSTPSVVKTNVSRKRTDVYDLINAGPRNRFTVYTDDGPIIVHNCVLGLGYQMGATRFQQTLEQGAMGPAVYIPQNECEQIVGTYRNANAGLKILWNLMGHILFCMMQGIPGEYKCIKWGKSHILLPNGQRLHYVALKGTVDDRPANGYSRWFTPTLEDATFYGKRGETRIFSGLLLENIVQAVSRIVVTDAMVTIDEQNIMDIASMTHDEIIGVCGRDEAKEVFRKVIRIMTAPLPWAPGLPLDAEGGYARNYSK